MKTLLLIIFFSIPSLKVLAEPVSVNYRNVPLVEFSESIFKGLLKHDYIISDDVLSDTKKITVQLQSIEPSALFEVVKTVLSKQQISLTDKKGVYYVEKSTPSVTQSAPNGNATTTIARSNESTQSDISIYGISDTPATGANNSNNAISDVQTNKQCNEIGIYEPRFRKSIFLSKVIKFAGGQALEIDESDKLIFCAKSVEQLEKIKTLISKLDTTPQAVTIKAALIEYTESQDQNRAFNFTSVIDALSSKLKLNYGAISTLTNQASFTGANITAIISATQGDSRFSYLANPVIRVLDGEKASLIIGNEVPTRGQQTVDRNGNIQSAYVYRSSGVQISVEPTIKTDFISLKVRQEMSSFQPTVTSNIDSPTLNKRQAETVLDAKRGEVMVLAGIDEDKLTDSNSGLPFIPKFLRNKTYQKTKSQILLLIEIVGEEKPT